MNDRWVWERPNAASSGVAGDIAKLFRNAPIEQPGVLGNDPPSDKATVLAREVIQNSWDAAGDLRDDLRKDQVRAERRNKLTRALFRPPPFEVRFRFLTADGSLKDTLVQELALTEHARRLAGRGVSRKEVNLGKEDCLKYLEDPAARLDYMVIEESSASGMYGPWEGDKSKMYKALCAIGDSSGPEGKGGSYGYGKAGLIRGSAIRTVVAYTCFRKREDDPGVTRRLLGMTYWGRHNFEGVGFTGFARFGRKEKECEVVPFENEEADDQAVRLGLDIRDPGRTGDLGTTFLLIDPTVTAKDLVVAIERWWWPALEDQNLQFNTSVHTTTGEVIYPRPRLDPVLSTFVDAYEIATHPQPNGSRADIEGLGIIGLVSEPNGWSYAEQTKGFKEQGVDHCSLVALMRKSRMVVEYYWARGWDTSPYVRGVFVADPCINEVLRETEPMDHNKWDHKSEDTSEYASGIAKRVYDRIRQKVRKYKKELKPPPRPPKEMVLKVWDQLITNLLTEPGRIRPDPAPSRPFSIKPSFRLEAAGSEEVQVIGKAKIAFSEHFKDTEALIEVYIRYMFLEDDRSGEKAELEVVSPPGFDGVDGKLRGILRRNHWAVFKFRTRPYRADWSGRLITEANILDGSKA